VVASVLARPWKIDELVQGRGRVRVRVLMAVPTDLQQPVQVMGVLMLVQQQRPGQEAWLLLLMMTIAMMVMMWACDVLPRLHHQLLGREEWREVVSSCLHCLAHCPAGPTQERGTY
jgi:hypothetical protein